MMNIEVVDQQSDARSGSITCVRTWFALPNESMRLGHFIETLANAPEEAWQATAKTLQQRLAEAMLFVWHQSARLDTPLFDQDRLVMAEPCRIDPKAMRHRLAALRR